MSSPMAGPGQGPGPAAYFDRSGHLVFEVKLNRTPGVKLGIQVLVLGSSSTSGIIIDEVSPDGLVAAWNQRSVEPYRIRSGDIIIRVNGVEGDGEALSTDLLLSDTFLQMAVLRVNYDVLRPSGKGGAEPMPPPPAGKGAMAPEPAPPAMPPAAGGGDPVQNLSQRMMQQYQQQLNQLQQQHAQQQLMLQQQQQMQLLGLQRLGQHLPAAAAPALPLPASPQGHGGKGTANTQLPAGGRGACGTGWASPPAVPEPPGLAAPSATASTALAACLEHTFEVYLVRPKGAKLGVGVQPARVGQIDGLSVRQISAGGAVDEWNQSCRGGYSVREGGYCVREGDVIVCINGISLNPQLMMEQVQTRHELLFTVLPQSAHPLFNGEAVERSPPS